MTGALPGGRNPDGEGQSASPPGALQSRSPAWARGAEGPACRIEPPMRCREQPRESGFASALPCTVVDLRPAGVAVLPQAPLPAGRHGSHSGLRGRSLPPGSTPRCGSRSPCPAGHCPPLSRARHALGNQLRSVAINGGLWASGIAVSWVPSADLVCLFPGSIVNSRRCPGVTDRLSDPLLD